MWDTQPTAQNCANTPTKIKTMPDEAPISIDEMLFEILSSRKNKLREHSFKFARGGVIELAGPSPNREQVNAALDALEIRRPDQFFAPGVPDAPKTASQRLAEANAAAAKDAAFEIRAPVNPKITMTDAERAKVEKMTPDQKLEFASRKIAEARKDAKGK
jgi:hypothetical protein